MGALVAAFPALCRGEPSFSRDIEPLLKQHCIVCHGEALQQSRLRLDDRADAMRGGQSGAVIVPGDASASALVKR
ncbi:MAG: hypothetical protein OXH83_10060 [Bryobacterales bacterium]|nr:hypothetical protein [Bryobacterales bacterium]